MEASTPMETSASVETPTEARLPARGKAMGGSSMIKATEGAGVGPALAMRCESMLASRKSSLSSAVKSAGSVKSACVVEVLAIVEDSAVGFVTVVVEKDAVVMPVISPVTPSPAKPTKETDPKAQAPGEPWPREVESGIPIPAGPDADRLSIDEPRIILRHINNFRICGLDLNSLSLLLHLFLRGALQVPRFFRPVAHYLNSIHHLLLLVDVSIAKR